MRLTAVFLAVVTAVVVPAQDHGPTVTELEAMERFVSQEDVRVTTSEPVARVEGGGSTAVFTPVVASDGTNRIRGIRIDFTSGSRIDRIYVSEELAGRLTAALDEIAVNADGFFKRTAGSSTCIGTGAFLDAMRAGAHFLYPSQCETADGWKGLSITTSRDTFRFTGVDSVPFATAIRDAVSAMKLL